MVQMLTQNESKVNNNKLSRAAGLFTELFEHKDKGGVASLGPISLQTFRALLLPAYG